MTAPRLRAVPTADPASPPRADLHDYESDQRHRSAATDWAKVHVAADRRAPFAIATGKVRWWRHD